MTDAPAEIFLSADVETLGPLPGRHRLLSVGVCAIDLEGRIHGRLHLRIRPVPGADAETPESRPFWEAHPDAWRAATEDAIPAPEAARRLRDFALNQTIPPGRTPPLAAWPLAFDAPWISWLLAQDGGRDPFAPGNSICIKTLAWALTGGPFHGPWSHRCDPVARHVSARPHVAIDDAVAQGRILVDVLRQLRGLSPVRHG